MALSGCALLSGMLLHVQCTYWNFWIPFLKHNLLLRVYIVPRDKMLAERTTSQATPSPQCFCKRKWQVRKEANITSLCLQLIVCLCEVFISCILAGWGGQLAHSDLGGWKPDQHSWEPREPDWQEQLQPMEMPSSGCSD